MRPSGAGLGNISGQECTFSYMYTCIGYKLPTFSERIRLSVERRVHSIQIQNRLLGNYILIKFCEAAPQGPVALPCC